MKKSIRKEVDPHVAAPALEEELKQDILEMRKIAILNNLKTIHIQFPYMIEYSWKRGGPENMEDNS